MDITQLTIAAGETNAANATFRVRVRVHQKTYNTVEAHLMRVRTNTYADSNH